MVKVKGRWALITGASRGIGSLLAQFMASQGCNLVLHSRSLEHTQSILEKVKEQGVQAYSVAADLANHNEVMAMLNEIENRDTEIDLLFNNAGVQIAYREDYWKTPIEDFELSFRINFIAVTTLCYHLIPKMIKRGFGRVINTTSGIMNEPEQAGYSASKAALNKYTQDLASKLDGTDVVINLTDPGWCRTDLGGPFAPNLPESTIPGVVVGAFVDDKRSGRIFEAQLFKDLTLKEAVTRAETT